MSSSHTFSTDQLIVIGPDDLRHWQFRALWDQGFQYWDIGYPVQRASLAIWPANDRIWLAHMESLTGHAHMSGIPVQEFGPALDQPVIVKGDNKHPFIDSAALMLIAAGSRNLPAGEVRSAAHFELLPRIDYRILVTAQLG
jgi:hypothetical protein